MAHWQLRKISFYCRDRTDPDNELPFPKVHAGTQTKVHTWGQKHMKLAMCFDITAMLLLLKFAAYFFVAVLILNLMKRSSELRI